VLADRDHQGRGIVITRGNISDWPSTLRRFAPVSRTLPCCAEVEARLGCQGSGELIALSSAELIRSFGPGEPGDFRPGESSLQLG
jgi:hypothetical protein